MKTYATRAEAIEREIVEPIEASGVVADARAEYDIDAIADKVIAWRVGTLGRPAARSQDGTGFRCEYANDPGPFWEIVAAHEVPRVSALLRQVEAALQAGDPLLGVHDGHDVDWTYSVGLDTIGDLLDYGGHMLEIEVAAGSVMIAHHAAGKLTESLSDWSKTPGVLVFEFGSPEIAALRDRWEAIFAYPYNDEIEDAFEVAA